MSIRILVTLAALLALVLAGSCAPAVYTPPQAPFPDFGFAPPPNYNGRLFRMRQDYPERQPATLRAEHPWLEIDFTQGERWRDYLEAIRVYAFEGMLEADWRSVDNRRRDWYDAPWMHYTAYGRDPIRGLTYVGGKDPRQFFNGPASTDVVGAYALALYNRQGGYTLGQVWKDRERPNPNAARFPVGTVIVKLEFTDATPQQVPQLANVPVWQASAFTIAPRRPEMTTPRSLKDLRLVQFNVAVRDDRALRDGGTGWVYGMWAANGALSTSTRHRPRASRATRRPAPRPG